MSHPSPYQFDAFISYNNNDWASVEMLKRRLSRDNINVWIDHEQIRGGSVLSNSIMKGIQQSRHVICCLSQNYLTSEWVEYERIIGHSTNPSNNQERLIPVKISLIVADIPLYFRGVYCPDLTNPVTWEQEYQKVLKTLLSSQSQSVYLQKALADEADLLGHRTQEESVFRHLLPHHNLPPRDYENFIGRQEEQKQIHRLLLPSSRVWIVTIDGIGGIGKSALALEMGHIYREQYTSLPESERFEAIVWLSAKSAYLTAEHISKQHQTFRNLNDLFAAIARVLDHSEIILAPQEDQREIVERVLREYRTLLLLDNLEAVEDEDLLDFLRSLPEPSKAIVTTRRRIDVAYAVRLEGMLLADTRILISQEATRKAVSLTSQQQEDLWDRTGGVPLAIVWSIGRIGLGASVKQVLQDLRRGQSNIARFCFDKSVEQIRGKDAHTLFLALSLFTTGASREALADVAGLDDEMNLDEGLSQLLQLSLANQEGETFILLPLTRTYALDELTRQPQLEPLLRKRWNAYLNKIARSAVLSSSRLAELGFRRDPFAFYEAEKMPWEVLEETFVAHPGFEEYVMNLDRSAVLLAAPGGGKTASRRQLEVFLARYGTAEVDSAPQTGPPGRVLIVIYNDFGSIVDHLPQVTLQDHIEPLLSAVAKPVFEFILSHPDLFVTLSDRDRIWWWSFLTTYLSGVSLEYRMPADQLLDVDYRRRAATRSAPFRANSSLKSIFDSLQKQLASLGFSRMFVLLDEIDGYLETQSASNLYAAIVPLLNALPLLSSPRMMWKLFLPDILEDVVKSASGYQSGRLDLLSITWDEASLKLFLQRRLEWANVASEPDIAQLCDQELLSIVDVKREFIQMALRHQRLGPPRALLYLGSQLLGTMEGERLSIRDWRRFEERVQYEFVPSTPQENV